MTRKIGTTLGGWALVWPQRGLSQDKDYWDDDPDQGETELPWRSLDGRQRSAIFQAYAEDGLLNTLPSSGATSQACPS